MVTLGRQFNAPPKRVDPSQFLKAIDVRNPMSPGQLWDFYQENRKEFDVALLPIPVNAFANDIPDPDPKKLDELFEKFKKASFDPSSDQPGFRKPQQVRVQYVSADLNSPFFKRIARVSDYLTSYPLGSFVPQMPLATALRFASAPLVTSGTLQRIYDNQLQYEQFSRPYYSGAPFVSSDIASPMAAWLAREQPLAAVSYIGAVARPDAVFAATPAYLAMGAVKNPHEPKSGFKEELLAGITMEVRRRVPLYATLFATGTMPTGLAVAGQAIVLADDRPRDPNAWPLLPLPIVQKTLLEGFDRALAGKYVNANMAFFKKKLEEQNVAGTAAQVKRLLERYGPRKAGDPPAEGGFRDLGLEIAQTDKFYDRYNIKDAPELKPLLEAYERYYTTVNQTEGREMRPETVLKEEDFWKLFFDGSESFSIAGNKYHAKPWPPVIKLGTPTQLETLGKRSPERLEITPGNLDEMIRSAQSREPNKDVTFNLFGTSNRPILFWKIDEKASEIPESLAEVKDRVLDAWKMQQARETKVLPYVKTLAERLLAGNSDYASMLKLEGAKLQPAQDIISLERLAPLYLERQHFGGPGVYTDFKLKRGTINFPRDDMVSQLLTLGDLKKPIEMKISDLDKLNADLFEAAKAQKLPGDKFVQVLANKPRDTFYLAVVQLPRGANAAEFFLSVLPGAFQGRDLLFERAQQRLGEEHFKELVRQLRRNHNVTIQDGAKSFDTDGGS
jgi:hypothetical protein